MGGGCTVGIGPWSGVKQTGAASCVSVFVAHVPLVRRLHYTAFFMLHLSRSSIAKPLVVGVSFSCVGTPCSRPDFVESSLTHCHHRDLPCTARDVLPGRGRVLLPLSPWPVRHAAQRNLGQLHCAVPSGSLRLHPADAVPWLHRGLLRGIFLSAWVHRTHRRCMCVKGSAWACASAFSQAHRDRRSCRCGVWGESAGFAEKNLGMAGGLVAELGRDGCCPCAPLNSAQACRVVSASMAPPHVNCAPRAVTAAHLRWVRLVPACAPRGRTVQ
jgi:hypothetical protein